MNPELNRLFEAVKGVVEDLEEKTFAIPSPFSHFAPAFGSGRSVAWLARLVRVQEVVSSNLTAPTILLTAFRILDWAHLKSWFGSGGLKSRFGRNAARFEDFTVAHVAKLADALL